MRWLADFIATLLLEGPIAVIGFSGDEPRISKRIAAAILANLATHPIAWLVAAASGWSPLVACAVEIAAVLVEAAIYSRALDPSPRGKAIAVSLLANGVSCLVVPIATLIAR